MLALYINDYDHVVANGRDITRIYKRGPTFVVDFIHHLFNQGDPEVMLSCRDEVAMRYGFDIGVANIYRFRRNDDGDFVQMDT